MANSRRELLLGSVVASLAASVLADGAAASPLNPAQTIIRPPDTLQWMPNKGYPDRSVDMCPLSGATTDPGLYYTLVRWWPGYMSAPHTYTSDRLCVVVSGTWWCNSGPDFDPDPAFRSWPAASSAGSPARRTMTASSAMLPAPR